jgi:transcriptional regulator with XRE-family HTH domain
MTEKQVADLIHVKQPVYHRYETGEGRPRVERAKMLGELFGFDWTIFYETKEEKGA